MLGTVIFYHRVPCRHPRFAGSKCWEGNRGLCPQRGPGADPLVREPGSEAPKPKKLEAFCCVISCFLYLVESVVEIGIFIVRGVTSYSLRNKILFRSTPFHAYGRSHIWNTTYKDSCVKIKII